MSVAVGLASECAKKSCIYSTTYYIYIGLGLYILLHMYTYVQMHAYIHAEEHATTFIHIHIQSLICSFSLSFIRRYFWIHVGTHMFKASD